MSRIVHVQFTALLVFLLLYSPSRAIAQNPPEWIAEAAALFAGLDTVTSVTQPRINGAHTHNFEVTGINRSGAVDREILVFIDSSSLGDTIVGFVKQCPRWHDFSDTVNVIDTADVLAAAYDFLSMSGFAEPPDFEQDRIFLRNIISEWRWEIYWSHRIDNGSEMVTVMPDFMLIQVEAENGRVYSYSKVEHGVSVSITPTLTEQEGTDAAVQALDSLGFATAAAVDAELYVVYPNAYFDSLKWQWHDTQALAWVVRCNHSFAGGEPFVCVWIDAHTGELLGGEVYEHGYGDLIALTNQQTDADIQYPYLMMMKYDNVDTTRSWRATESTVSNMIWDDANQVFILHSHGDTVGDVEYTMLSGNHTDTTDQWVFTPDEVPNHNLHYALMSHCMSGYGSDLGHYKDRFLAACDTNYFCFQGYTPYINPDNYEDREFYHFAMGRTIENAHDNAISESGFSDQVHFKAKGCENNQKLAPLLVDVSHWPNPVIPGVPFSFHVKVTNREDAGQTESSNVRARIIPPAGFELLPPNTIFDLGMIDWAETKDATWWVVSTTATPGNHVFDVEVYCTGVGNQLGVEVDDPDKPLHRRNVTVIASTYGMFGDPAIWPGFDTGSGSPGDLVSYSFTPGNFADYSAMCTGPDTFCVHVTSTSGWDIHGDPDIYDCIVLDPGEMWTQNVSVKIPEDATPGETDSLFVVMAYCNSDGYCYYESGDCEDPNWPGDVPFWSGETLFTFVDDPTGVVESSPTRLAPGLFMSPNPIQRDVEILLQGARGTPASLEIFTTGGRLVWKHETTIPVSGREILTWNGIGTNGRPASSGIYLVRFKTQEKVLSRRVVLVR